MLAFLKRALGLRSGRRETQAFVWQRRLVRNEEPLIADVGAHRGETAELYRAAFPKATIHCFEPFPTSHEELSRRVAKDPRVHAHRVALGAAQGQATLNANRSSATNSLLRSDERSTTYWGSGLLDTDSRVDVPLTTLDAFCAEQSIAHLDILKLDVQGTEYEVLAGAGELLRKHAIDLVYMEMIMAPTYVGQHELHDYLAAFRNLGYVLFDFYNPVRRNGRLLQTDNLLVAEPFLAAYEREQSNTNR